MIRIKKSTKQYLLVFTIIITIISASFIIAYRFNIAQIKQQYQEKIEEANKEIESNQRIVYVAKEKIKPGTVIKKSKIKKVKISSNLAKEYYFSQDDIGKVALLPIEPNIPIFLMMITETGISKSIREEEFNIFRLNSNLKNDDFVDIRIRYPNGESFIVLSKKLIKNVALETANCFLHLSEEEILRLSSAIVDANIFEAQLYTVKYIEPSIQPASIVTYVPSIQSIQLIEKDPNIIKVSSNALSEQVRLDLEVRLKTFKVAYENIQNNEKSNQVITNGESTTEETEELGDSDTDSIEAVVPDANLTYSIDEDGNIVDPDKDEVEYVE